MRELPPKFILKTEGVHDKIAVIAVWTVSFGHSKDGLTADPPRRLAGRDLPSV